MQMILMRHAESEANTLEARPHLDGDFSISLSLKGFEQAKAASAKLSRDFIEDALIYCSPYTRTRQTLSALLEQYGIEPPVFEDPLIREQDRGYLDEESQLEARRAHGWFWYRHAGGESPADCYLRVSVFIDSLYRELKRCGKTRVFIVTHGMLIRCFVMRFMHLTHEQFLQMRNPCNADVVEINNDGSIRNPVFSRGRWAVSGIQLREPDIPAFS